MKAATWPRPRSTPRRLLAIDVARRRHEHLDLARLPDLVRPGDLWVLNDAATLPASLAGRLGDAPLELRLVSPAPGDRWHAVMLGAGSWRTPTEHRPPPPPVVPGDRIQLDGPADTPPLPALVERVLPASPRLLELSFTLRGPALWRAVYALGRPVQYAYLDREVPLGAMQTAYASRPWAAEMPSAGHPLTLALLLAIQRRGASLAGLTHAAGLSSIGDDALDAALPFEERFEIPPRTAALVEDARAAGRRIVAVGTTVVRALEAAAAPGGPVQPGLGVTGLRIGPGYRLRVASAILTGMHEPRASHFALLRAFAPEALLLAAHADAEARGYLAHEFGDSCFVARE